MKIITRDTSGNAPLRAMAILSALLLSACSTGPVIFTNESPLADFAAYGSFTFVENPATDDREGVRSLLSQYLMSEITGQMVNRGYQPAGEDADLAFDFMLATKEKLRSVPSADFGGYYWGGYRHYGYGYGNSYRITQYTEGTLRLVIIDKATNGIIWEGGSIKRVTDDVRDNLDLAVREAVTEIFSRYPYYAAGTRPPAPATNETS